MRREKSGQVRVCSPEETDSEEEHIDIHVINSFILMKRPRRAPKKAPKPVLCALSLQPIPKDVCVFQACPLAPAFMRREKSGQVIATSGRKHGEGNWKRKEPFMARELRSLLFVKCILSS